MRLFRGVAGGVEDTDEFDRRALVSLPVVHLEDEQVVAVMGLVQRHAAGLVLKILRVRLRVPSESEDDKALADTFREIGVGFGGA